MSDTYADEVLKRNLTEHEIHDADSQVAVLYGEVNKLRSANQQAMVLLNHIWEYVDGLKPGPTWGQDKTKWLVDDHRKALLKLDAVEHERTLDAKLLDNVTTHWQRKCVALESRLDAFREALQRVVHDSEYGETTLMATVRNIVQPLLASAVEIPGPDLCERTHERYRDDGTVERWTTVETVEEEQRPGLCGATDRHRVCERVSGHDGSHRYLGIEWNDAAASEGRVADGAGE